MVTIIVCVIAVSVGVIAMVRTRLKNKSKELTEKLNQISSYSEKSNYKQARLSIHFHLTKSSTAHNYTYDALLVFAVLPTTATSGTK